MSLKINLLLISTVVLLLLSHTIPTAAAVKIVSRNPYAGAIVVDAATGKVLFEDNADAKGYPASVTKLMVLLVILEAVDSHHLSLKERITVTAEAAKIGGSQVYLRENEAFSVDDLLYALMVESANDAATALAIHYAGSKEAFVQLMNKRAQELGMRDTVFHSVHGLPPGKGQLPDVSTPRDFAKLCRELLKRRDALKYTSTKERSFRTDGDKPFVMRNHNKLLKSMNGCDGLKTGYFRAAGYSIAATASKDDQRAVAVVFGSVDARVRDSKTKKMLSEGLMHLVMNPSPPPPAPASESIEIKKSTLRTFGAGIGGLLLVGFVLVSLKSRTRAI